MIKWSYPCSLNPNISLLNTVNTSRFVQAVYRRTEEPHGNDGAVQPENGYARHAERVVIGITLKSFRYLDSLMRIVQLRTLDDSIVNFSAIPLIETWFINLKNNSSFVTSKNWRNKTAIVFQINESGFNQRYSADWNLIH